MLWRKELDLKFEQNLSKVPTSIITGGAKWGSAIAYIWKESKARLDDFTAIGIFKVSPDPGSEPTMEGPVI